MKSDRSCRRSIRYSIFIGVLAGSVFSASGAFADGLMVITLEKTNVGGTGFGLNEIKSNLGGDFKLESNIVITDLGTITNEYWDSFTGTFDGDGHTISGLTDSLFYNTNNASISNLILRTDEETGITTTNSDVGILATSIRNTLVDNLQVYGDIIGGNRIGGIVGEASNSTITKSNSYANVTGNYYVGGLVGKSINSEISISTGDGVVTGFSGVGGLVGYGVDTNIVSSNVAGIINGTYGVGGAIGSLEGNLIDGEYTSKISSVNSEAEVRGVYGSASIGGIVGGGVTIKISNSEVTANVNGTDYIGGVIGEARNVLVDQAYFGGILTGSSGVGGIIGAEYGSMSTVTNSTVIAEIDGNNEVGGVLGYANHDIRIENSYFSGRATAETFSAGGLIGGAMNNSTIKNSFAIGTVNGQQEVGGLIGYSAQTEVLNSYSNVSLFGHQFIGGLIGLGNSVEITNFFSSGNIEADLYAGGLAGKLVGNARLQNTYSSGDLFSNPFYAGRIGYIYNDVTATNSYASGHFNSETTEEYLFNSDVGSVMIINDFESNSHLRSIADIFGLNYEPGFNQDKTWGSCSKVNSGNPFLTSHFGKNPCVAIPVINFGSYTEKIESNSIQEIQKTVGFKNEIPLPRNAPIAFVEATEKIDLAKVKAVEISPTAYVKVNTKTGEALQISLKSEIKEPVELWVKSPDGSWLLAGVITFDKDGKAILPPLLFKNAGDYSLVLSKPTADSAKGSAPLNQIGSLLVAVS